MSTLKTVVTATPLYFLFLSLLFLTSCKGQETTELPTETTDQIIASESKVDEVDPYFNGTQTFTTSKGPERITRNVLQDRNGHYWFATWDGIIRYDGESFTNFTNKEGLRRFRVFSMLEDSNGIIWFGTIGAGLYRYDGESFTNITTKNGLVNDSVGCIYEDKSGHIWFGTQAGISCCDPSASILSFRNFSTENGLPNGDINSIIEDKKGKFWFGSRGEAFYSDSSLLTKGPKGNTFTIFKNKQGAPFVNVRSIIEDKKGNIWLGGNDGFWRFDGLFLFNGNSLTKYSTDFVGYIYEDKEGNIWTSSAVDGNANRWKLSRYDVKTLLDMKPTVSQVTEQQDMFFGIIEDKDGAIWFGTLNGVCRYNIELSNEKRFEYFR
ncbi:MAG: ligand-binding sensor domain-containing protein [Polaribacter sp.]|jgi:ligand-binding sensor domain-containing protein